MNKRVQVRTTDAIELSFDPSVCAHAARCLKLLPGVFNLQARPWMQPGNAPVEELVAAVHECPSGALTYRRLDGGPQEAPAGEVSFEVTTDGPIHARGDLTILDAEGGVLRKGSRLALCRCGNSGNRPSCDGSHRAAAFRAP